jgi:hypothetical protein
MKWIAASIVTAAGDLESTCDAVRSGRSAWRPHPPYRPHVAPVPALPDAPRSWRFLSAIDQHALAEACALRSGSPMPPRTGLYVATHPLRADWPTLLKAMERQRSAHEGPHAHGLGRMHPLWMLRYLPTGLQSLLGAELELNGDVGTFGGPTSGVQALEAASRALRSGEVEHALVVGADDRIVPEVLVAQDAACGAAAAALLFDGTLDTGAATEALHTWRPGLRATLGELGSVEPLVACALEGFRQSAGLGRPPT